MAGGVYAEGAKTAKIQLLDVVRRGLEDHLVLGVGLEPVRVLPIAGVIRADARLDVGDTPRLRTENSQEGRGIQRSSSDFGVERLSQHTALTGPIFLEPQQHCLHGRHWFASSPLKPGPRSIDRALGHTAHGLPTLSRSRQGTCERAVPAAGHVSAGRANSRRARAWASDQLSDARMGNADPLWAGGRRSGRRCWRSASVDEAELLEAGQGVLQRPCLGDSPAAEAEDGDLVDPLEAAAGGSVAEPLAQVGG